MKKKFQIYISLVMLILAISSCTERINIDLDESYVRLAVEGYITPEEGEQHVKLTKTSDYFYNNPPQGVTQAQVKVTTGDSAVLFVEDLENPGYYRAPIDFRGIPQQTYSLEIQLKDAINNSVYYQSTEIMPHQPAVIDSIELEYNARWERWLVHLYAWEPPSVNYYLFNGYVNGEIITDSVSRKSVTDDKLYNGNYTGGITVMVLYKDEISPGDTFTLSLSNITKSYYDFILNVQEEIQPKNPLFSGPPANVISNIDNDAVGYFAAFSSSYASVLVTVPEDWK
ncbi:MAG: hypothetical protein COW63_07110 [Bacteroidetes bacterium CG18_big_fil_WC_8_21_14_2_50_41_14]|nr:MAG: hypothetical protein COW63_07110 [Bacteroidetes bacterium CG18_big_fil_WC_8_21_14_2_50_41_14]PJB59031.1 MAG: hypothetical protein CO098_05530 [Bacteroidetes bacterium CG_4_9_14_3_um_filter_41_19]